MHETHVLLKDLLTSVGKLGLVAASPVLRLQVVDVRGCVWGLRAACLGCRGRTGHSGAQHDHDIRESHRVRGQTP